MIELTLPYPISSNRYWKAITIPGRTMMAPSKEAKEYKAQVGWLAKKAGITAPFAGRIALHIQLYPQRPQDWARRAKRNPATWDDDVRCIDLGNAEKVLSDALNGVAWLDDKQHRRIVLERMEPDGDARVVVRIEQLASAPAAQGELLAGCEA